jgi:hypothetical protein
MSPLQLNAFKEGAGSLMTAPDLLFTLQAIGATAAITFLAWLCYQAYMDFGDGTITPTDMLIVWIRGVFILMVLLHLLID